MKKKKLKLKKQVYFILGFIIFLIVAGIVGKNMYNQYLYRQTNEYKLLEKGYTNEEITLLETKTNEEIIAKILEVEKNDTIINIIKEKYFLTKNYDEYLNYQKNNQDTSIKDVIALVNTHASNKWYQVDLKTDLGKKELMLVNKFYALNKDYEPKNAQNISLDYSYGTAGENKLIDYAYEAWQNLWQAAHEEGYYLMVNDSYRDYNSQKEIYDDRKTRLGERKADETAARPGHSEHQTGLVVDMTSKTEPYSTEFTESKAYKWLKENAYKYGWIERYPEGKTYITGYSPESWHWRYVGKNVAKVMHEENITFDEYYAFYIEK